MKNGKLISKRRYENGKLVIEESNKEVRNSKTEVMADNKNKPNSKSNGQEVRKRKSQHTAVYMLPPLQNYFLP